MAHPYWPLFDLEIRTPRLMIRYPDDATCVELAALAATGIHDPGYMPFSIPWTQAPSPKLEREALRFYWRTRAETSPESFRLPLAVRQREHGGRLVGMTDLFTTDFAKTRQFTTGSWLGREHQGAGIGKGMRLATLTLGFVGFGAARALTAAWHDNGPSNGVTRALGYEQVGSVFDLRGDEPVEQLHYRMDRAHFDTIRSDDIEIVGLEPVLELLELLEL
jgi:RimJ/RimL family protein N-acetyltransferase